MFAKFRTLIRWSLASSVFIYPSLGMAAFTPKDAVYIHCANEIGDLRLSDLNRSVTRYSVRYKAYRNLCSACNITEWGNTIILDDENGVFVRIDRLKGSVYIKDRDGDIEDNDPGGPHSYRGSCVRSQMIVPAPAIAARRF